MTTTDHTAHLEAAATTWLVEYDDREIARSDHAVVLHESYNGRDMPPVVYFPPAAVSGAILESTDHHTTCPIKGEAAYYTATVGEAVLENAVWYYPTPLEGLSDIAGYLAFYPDRFTVRPA